MPTPLERRILTGDARPGDADWLAFLDLVFEDVSLAGFAAHGMPPELARRLVNLLAMSRRLNQESAA